MQTIAVLNAKGGSGKSTLVTNLASLYASTGHATAVIDYDPQGSSLQWLSLRGPDRAKIEGINGSRKRTGVTRAWQLSVPPDTQRLIIDAPAGVRDTVLQEIVRRSNIVIVPVVPSPIDIHATSDFFRDLLIVGRVRQYNVQVAVVANRVRPSAPLYEPLARFFSSLKIPVIATLSDTDSYIVAAERGLGIHELDRSDVQLELEQWLPIRKWLENPKHGNHSPQLERASLTLVHNL